MSKDSQGTPQWPDQLCKPRDRGGMGGKDGAGEGTGKSPAENKS